jgi:hypothetical protein
MYHTDVLNASMHMDTLAAIQNSRHTPKEDTLNDPDVRAVPVPFLRASSWFGFFRCSMLGKSADLDA